MVFELRDGATGGLVAGFASEALALAVVRRALDTGTYRRTWELATIDRCGVRSIVAAGENLARRARESDRGSGECASPG